MSDKTVSLVLGSGGARGLAHIGVLDWLDEHKFNIQSIAGSSMGALIGGIYAAGKLDAYKKWVVGLDKGDVLKMLDLSFSPGGLFKGSRIIDKLRDLIGDFQIEDLDYNFTAVATDIESGKEVWLTEGSLFDAIRASIAVPMVFTPFKINKHYLLDGGLVNPVPIAPTLTDQTDITIAVNVSAAPREMSAKPEQMHKDSQKKPARKKTDSEDDNYLERIKSYMTDLQSLFIESEQSDKWSFFEIMTRSVDIMQDNIARLKLAAYNPDVIINISRDQARAYEFHRAKELIEHGYKAAGDGLRHLL